MAASLPLGRCLTRCRVPQNDRVLLGCSRRVFRVQALSSQVERYDDEASFIRPLSLFASAAVAAALVASPVEAGVILEQPQLKRIDLSQRTDKGSTQTKKSAPSVSSGSSMSGENGLNLDLGFFSLPLTLGGCAALYVAASKLDANFDDFMSRAWVKDSVANGIGYEEIYKSTDYTTGKKSAKR